MPKPAALKRLNGNPGKRAIKEEPQPVGPLEMPRGLTGDAAREWDRAVAAMPPGFYTAADAPGLAVYCRAWVQFMASSKTLEREGLTAVGAQGQAIAHPAASIQAKQAELILKASDRLGMSPVARVRLATPAKKDAGKFEGLLGGKPLKVVTSSERAA
jgi:P27 family predicted phage terminase small subunit